jgi:hypothetical protein
LNTQLRRVHEQERIAMATQRRPWPATEIIWSVLVAVLVGSVIGFGWFGHGFGRTTHADAERIPASVVTKSLLAVCVARARESIYVLAVLKQRPDCQIWRQSEFVETPDWATPPHGDFPDSGVADLCVSRPPMT